LKRINYYRLYLESKTSSSYTTVADADGLLPAFVGHHAFLLDVPPITHSSIASSSFFSAFGLSLPCSYFFLFHGYIQQIDIYSGIYLAYIQAKTLQRQKYGAGNAALGVTFSSCAIGAYALAAALDFPLASF
jgi:hypothetical protein